MRERGREEKEEGREKVKGGGGERGREREGGKRYSELRTLLLKD